MGQLQDFLRSDFSTSDLKKSRICFILGQSDPLWGHSDPLRGQILDPCQMARRRFFSPHFPPFPPSFSLSFVVLLIPGRLPSICVVTPAMRRWLLFSAKVLFLGLISPPSHLSPQPLCIQLVLISPASISTKNSRPWSYFLSLWFECCKIVDLLRYHWNRETFVTRLLPRQTVSCRIAT